MAAGATMQGSAEGQSCFSWIGQIPCLSRHSPLVNSPKDKHKVRTSSVQREHGLEQWSLPGPNTAELLHVVFPELPTARHFFKRFVADNSNFTLLEGDLAPWNSYMHTSDGELTNWTEDKTRRMTFLAYPVPPGWVPFQKYILAIEQRHRYQFVIDKTTGAEVLQIEKHIEVHQKHGHVPYADSFTMRQLWTVCPLGSGTGCDLHIVAEHTFIGRTPLLAHVIRTRAFSDHRNGTQDWLRGARACLERLASTPSENSLAVDVDEEESGAGTLEVQARNSKYHKNVSRFACPWAWLMTLLVCIMWISFVAVEVGNQVMPNPVKVTIDPIYPSVLLSLRGLLAL